MSAKLAQAVEEALAKGYQIHAEALEILEHFKGRVDLVELVAKTVEAKKMSEEQQFFITKEDLERLLPPTLKEAEEAEKPSLQPVEIEPEVEVVKDPTVKIRPGEGAGAFQSLFKSRYEKLLAIVKQRPDSGQIKRIASLKDGRVGKEAKVAGLVLEKKVRRNQVGLVVDDETGSLKVLALDVNIRRSASAVSLDQLVMLDLEFSSRGAAIVKAVHSPDIPDHRPNLAKKTVYAVLTSDIHIGSRAFLGEAFQRLIAWLSGRAGEEELVRRIKYLIVGGDVVDGIGVYPDQEQELEETDIYKQYEKAASLIGRIPKHIKIILAPGNHDTARQSLPQPAISRLYAEPLYGLENVTVVGNPAHLRLHGVNILVYHGQSLYDVVATTPGLTFSRPAEAMKVLLKARHLAPMYGARTPIAPEPEDHLVIEDIPDIFQAGHIHTIDREDYRGTLVINSGTWQARTKYQSNMGIEPTPAIVPIVNLATLDVFTRDFSKPMVQQMEA